MWYIYDGMIFSLKKKPILPFVTMWMDLEGITLSEISEMDKDKYCKISFIVGI